MIKDLLIQTLEPFGYPIILQGSLGKDEQYPDMFFTFWNNAADGDSYYDNDEHSYIWNFDLNWYTNDPSNLNTMLLDAKEKLKEKGFVVTGAGYDVGSDYKTHTGRGINVLYIEKLKGGN